jgi:aerobic carbon-monoxide dehydrogenase small subunit
MSVNPLVPISLHVNGQSVALAVPPSTLLVDLLREQLALTGTHQGCDTAQCGACTVLVDGAATKSCNVLALQILGASVVTIEGLEAADGSLHPMQQAFGRHHAPAMRFLHTGHGHARRSHGGRGRARRGASRQPGAVRQPVPLHRLPRHCQRRV